MGRNAIGVWTADLQTTPVPGSSMRRLTISSLALANCRIEHSRLPTLSYSPHRCSEYVHMGFLGVYPTTVPYTILAFASHFENNTL